MTDVIDDVAGISPGSALWELRRQRPEVVRHSQASYGALLDPRDPGGLCLAERAAIALRVAELNDDDALAAHYRNRLAGFDSEGRLGTASDGADGRWPAIRRHVERVATAPGTATPAHIRELEASGVGAREIVTLSQLVAFVSYQVRALAGLRLLGQAR